MSQFLTELVFALQQAGQGDAQSTMEVVGMKSEMDMRSLLVWLVFLLCFASLNLTVE